VRAFVAIVVGVALAFAWLTVWLFTLRAFGVRVFVEKLEDRASRRERLKEIGKLRYVVMFGVLGSGLALGLAITTAELLAYDSRSWVSGGVLLLFVSVLLGWYNGARSWREAFRDPVPFPPSYPPPKQEP
jgi:hypothetical protein